VCAVSPRTGLPERGWEKSACNGTHICSTDMIDVAAYSVAMLGSRPCAESGENGVNDSCGDADQTRFLNGRL